jgi:hypothetical protein
MALPPAAGLPTVVLPESLRHQVRGPRPAQVPPGHGSYGTDQRAKRVVRDEDVWSWLGFTSE